MKKIIALLLCAVLLLALVPVIAIPAMADEKITVPARPTLTNTTDKSYLAFAAPATPAVTHVKNFGDASAALTSGGTIVVTQKALYSFKSPDAANTVDGTKGTVLVTAKEGDTSYINIETDTKETGIILGNNNFAEQNWDKVDYLLLAGDVILDDVVLFNRAHKPASADNAPMDTPNSVRALAGSRVVIGSGVQFAHRFELPNMLLDTEEGAVVFIDALGFSKYTGKGTLVIAKDLVDKVTADTFAGFEGKVVDVDGNALFASAPVNPTPTNPTPTNPTPATGSMTVVIAAGAILASLGALVALKKREER
ncbi:MAG: LPXTG cell wall anchor domain-containing protein [Clostridia bacterium]|nr:LPXTG cell wall anchor domain-containing protein [Clostridia bacterium]